MLPVLLEIVYPLFCTFFPCTVFLIFTVKRLENKQHLLRHTVWVYLFLFYIYMVFQVTGFGTIWDIGLYGDIIRYDEIRLVPFQNGVGMGDLLNVIMFMPLGFLLPLIWERYRNIFRVILTSAGLSLAIELGQLFNRRITDINDLLMNTAGALLGYIIWLIFKKIFKKSGEKSIQLSGNEPVLYLILSFLGNFLLFNWKILLKILEAFQ